MDAMDDVALKTPRKIVALIVPQANRSTYAYGKNIRINATLSNFWLSKGWRLSTPTTIFSEDCYFSREIKRILVE